MGAQTSRKYVLVAVINYYLESEITPVRGSEERGRNYIMTSTSTTASVSVTNGTESSTRASSRIILPAKWHGLEEQTECPVCADFLIGTIRMCTRGHSICEKCNEVVSHCPLCRRDMSQVRNYFMEYFMENCTFKCKYFDQGCTVEIKPSGYHSHTDRCHFREVSCRAVTYDKCEAITNFKDFIPHLSQRHKIRAFKNGMEYCYRFPRDKGKIFQTPYATIEFDNKSFFYNFATHTMTSPSGKDVIIAVWWVSFFNPSNDKTQYRCKIKIGSIKNKQMVMSYAGPVHDFRVTAEEVLSDELCLSATLPGLKLFCCDDEKNPSYLFSHIESAEIMLVEQAETSLMLPKSENVTILSTEDLDSSDEEHVYEIQKC